ncbi:MAG TPA: hypothetical protein VG708_09755 [Mycobacteriales bacterium]|nr:hypothetical protein [Mycobacteriales bacterium]
MLVAAQLYAGPRSAIDGLDACRFHGVNAARPDEDRVHVVEPWGEPARTTGFVVVRRTLAPIVTVATDLLRYVDPATAVIAAARRARSDRSVLALLSDGLQRRVTSYPDLVRAHIQGSPRNARRTERALAELGAGARSAPEVDFLHLAEASVLLPRPLCNPLLRLTDGRLISPDALFVESAVVHETNGRVAHDRQDLFEDMQTRHDALTASGFVVLHNSPRRIRLHGREVISEVERCHARHLGRGMPPGVEILRLAA